MEKSRGELVIMCFVLVIFIRTAVASTSDPFDEGMFLEFTMQQNGELNVTTDEMPQTDDMISPNFTTKAAGVVGVVDDVHATWSWYPTSWPWYTIVQLISSVTGIIGNGLVIVVLCHPKRDRRSTDILILNLAVADFLTSVCLIPIPRNRQLPSTTLGQFYCKFVIDLVFFNWVGVVCSAWTLVAIAVERYVAVAYPFRFKFIFSKKRTYLYVIALWIHTLAIVAVYPVLLAVNPIYHICDDSAFYQTQQGTRAFGLMMFLLKFAIPSVMMLIPQVLTARRLSIESTRFTEGANQRGSHTLQLLKARRRVIHLLFLVMILFVIFWGPSMVGFLFVTWGVVDRKVFYLSVYRQISTTLRMYNSCVNPIIYTIRFPAFRQAIAAMVCGDAKTSTSTSLFGEKSAPGTKESKVDSVVSIM